MIPQALIWQRLQAPSVPLYGQVFFEETPICPKPLGLQETPVSFLLRIRKRYVGTGEVAELLAHADATVRRTRAERQKRARPSSRGHGVSPRRATRSTTQRRSLPGWRCWRRDTTSAKANGGGGAMLELELTDEVRERVAELRALSEKVQDREEGARTELRRALRESAPGVLARCSNAGR